jgi:pimeloyl-ACP methyl ester carboxylesterase
MTIIGQNKIIYMPYMPPFTRSEEMADYVDLCKPVEWRLEKIRSLDGTKLAICVGHIAGPEKEKPIRHIVIVHFHGNGGSLPPRLPLLSDFLKAIESQAIAAQLQVEFTMVALSPRGYWKSSGRASQKGIEKDAQALLQWISSSLSADNENMEFILWGQSLGAGVATTAAATYLTRPKEDTTASPPIIGLLLETPFTSIKSMLLALYPQKWLPYKYLHPFLWNHWDSPAALAKIGELFAQQGRVGDAPKVLLVISEKDEVVPAEEAMKLEEACEKAGLHWMRKDAAGALHVDALAKRGGRDQAAKWVVEVVRGNDGTAE